MPSTTFNYQTAAAVRTAAPNAINIVFNERLRRGSAETDNPFAQWQAADAVNGLSGAPVTKITDLAKSAGDTVHFTKLRGLNTKAILGESTLMGNESKAKFGTYSVTLDFIRHGTAFTRKQIKLMAAGKDVTTALSETVDRLMGLTQRDFIMQRLRERVTTGRNLIFASASKSSLAALTSSDYVSSDAIVRAGNVLTGIGGKPISMRKLKNGASVPNFLHFAPNEVLNALYSDTNYNNAANYAGVRGDENVLFSGGFVNWRGQSIYHWNVIDEDTSGPIGSYFNPKAELGVAVAAGTAAVALKGGGANYDAADSPAIDYWRYFPGGSSIGKQYEDETRASDTGDYFIKVVTVTGAAPGKWGFFRYIGDDNTGTTVTTAAYSATTGRGGGRLGGTANGGGADTRDTTCGYVTWDADKNTETLPQGSLCYHANARGQILGYIGTLGSDAVLVAHGGGAGDVADATFRGSTNYKGRASSVDGASLLNDSDDYGMRISLAAEGVFGVDVPKNSAAKYTNHLIMPVVYTPAAGGGL